MPVLRLVGAVHAVAVDRAGPRVGQIAVPDLVGVFGQLDALELALAVVVEQAELDLGRVGREQREIDAEPVPGGAERKGRPSRMRERRMTCGIDFSAEVSILDIPLCFSRVRLKGDRQTVDRRARSIASLSRMGSGPTWQPLTLADADKSARFADRQSPTELADMAPDLISTSTSCPHRQVCRIGRSRRNRHFRRGGTMCRWWTVSVEPAPPEVWRATTVRSTS